jgi:hypothetical protein
VPMVCDRRSSGSGMGASRSRSVIISGRVKLVGFAT